MEVSELNHQQRFQYDQVAANCDRYNRQKAAEYHGQAEQWVGRIPQDRAYHLQAPVFPQVAIKHVPQIDLEGNTSEVEASGPGPDCYVCPPLFTLGPKGSILTPEDRRSDAGGIQIAAR